MKVAIYVRLSEEDKNKAYASDESESIQNQKSMLLNYALDKKWDVYKIYCDEDYSGADRSRPEFNNLIADAKAKKFNIVLCKSQSRFVRDMEQMEKYLHNDFLEWGIRFISLVDNADNFDSKNKKSRQINGLINEWYLEDISDNIKAVFRNKHREGKSTRSFMPYGYAKEGKNSVVVDEEAAGIVGRIFNSYSKGMPTSKICEMLNQEGVLPPHAYKQSKGIKLAIPHRMKVPSWTSQTLVRILRNQMYIGDLVHNTYKKVSYKSQKIVMQPKEKWTIIRGVHEAIVEREVFDKVQSMLDLRIKPRKTGEAHMFAKKVVCGECGGRMHKLGKKYKESEYSYLRCHTFGHCTVKFEELENIVVNRLHRLFTKINCNEVINELESKTDESVRLKKELAKVEEALGKQNEYLKNIYQDKVKGFFDDDEFIALKSDFSEEQVRLKKRQRSLNETISAWQARKDNNEDKIALVKQFQHFECLTRNIVDEFVECIEIGKEEITINWAV